MHRLDADNEVLIQAVIRYAVERLRMDPPPLDHPRTEDELRAMAGHTVTPGGVGGLEALRIFSEVLAPACISIDHPRFLSFVPSAPTEAATLFDLVVGAGGMFGGTWMESSGAVFAENEALRWLADLAGLPASAGGVFVSGGSAGNLSALVAARFRWRLDDPARRVGPAADRGVRGRALLGRVGGEGDGCRGARGGRGRAGTGRRCGVRGRPGRARPPPIATGWRPSWPRRARPTWVSSTTWPASPTVAADLGAWFHVDAAYGGAAMAVPRVRPLFDGIEQADSFVVDPHKWLFAPFDCAALLYREPAIARATHTQHAEYLDVVTEQPHWNPSDYAYHLSRRARGLPFWFSLATHGTDAYAAAVAVGIDLAEAAAALIRRADHLELVVEPGLSIVVFRRLGWTRDDYYAWSDRIARRRLGLRRPHVVAGRDGAAVLLREPQHDHRGRRADPRLVGLTR